MKKKKKNSTNPAKSKLMMEIEKIKPYLSFYLKSMQYEKTDIWENNLCCSYSGCKEQKIIKSHLYSNYMLNNIAEEKQVEVYMHRFNMKNPEIFSLVSPDNASIFRGFCQKHDKDLFSSFEVNIDKDKLFFEDDEYKSKQQYDSYLYRIISFEYYHNQIKKKQYEQIPANLFTHNDLTTSNLNIKAIESFKINPDQCCNINHYSIKISGAFNCFNFLFINKLVLNYFTHLLSQFSEFKHIANLLKLLSINDGLIIFNILQIKENESIIVFSWDSQNNNSDIILHLFSIINKYLDNIIFQKSFFSFIFFINSCYASWLIKKPDQKNYLSDYENYIFNKHIQDVIQRKYSYFNLQTKHSYMLPIYSPFIKGKNIIKKQFFLNNIDYKEKIYLPKAFSFSKNITLINNLVNHIVRS